jgi:hypothetical protein
MDDGEEWLFLFTYEKLPPSEDKIKWRTATSENHL